MLQHKRPARATLKPQSSLQDGFVLYDADDRLVTAHRLSSRESCGRLWPIVPGASFESILRMAGRGHQPLMQWAAEINVSGNGWIGLWLPESGNGTSNLLTERGSARI